MSELYCLAYGLVVVFSKTHRFLGFFVLNKCVLWLQSRNCFTGTFVTLLCRACVRTKGLIWRKFSRPSLVYTEVCGSRVEVFLRQFFVI